MRWAMLFFYYCCHVIHMCDCRCVLSTCFFSLLCYSTGTLRNYCDFSHLNMTHSLYRQAGRQESKYEVMVFYGFDIYICKYIEWTAGWVRPFYQPTATYIHFLWLVSRSICFFFFNFLPLDSISLLKPLFIVPFFPYFCHI